MIYKLLDWKGESCHGGHAKWDLPIKNPDGTWTPGAWMPEIKGALIICERGYHAVEDDFILDWLTVSATRVFELEYRGECSRDLNKLIVRRCRLLREFNWDRKEFCFWCIREVLPLVADERMAQVFGILERPQATIDELEAARIMANNLAKEAGSLMYVGTAYYLAGALEEAAYGVCYNVWNTETIACCCRCVVKFAQGDFMAMREAQYRKLQEMIS